MPTASEIVHPDISDVSKAFAVLGFFIVVYGQISYVLKERLYMSEPLIAVTLGVIVGPYVLGWVDPRSWSDEETFNELTFEFTRLVVGVQVLFTGIALPKAYLRREALSLTVLLFGIMTTAWFVTGLLIWGLIRLPASVAPDGVGYSFTYLESLCIAAAVTPTDPVLASSITKGRYAEKHVPANVRNIILAESGANDGLGFPFLYIAIYLLDRTSVDRGTSVGTEVGRWVYAVVIFQIILSTIYGFVLGYIARKTLKWAESRQYIDKDNFFAFGLGLALFTLGTVGLFGSDDILACFVAGNSFTWDDWFRIRSEESDVQDILDNLLNAAVFIYIGAIIPWDWYHVAATIDGPTVGGIETWRIVVLGITVLLLRRPPWVIAATKAIPALRTFGESAFAGWFGPIGVGAVFYIEVALREIPDNGARDRLRDMYEPIVLFCVFSSVFTHGVTIPISKLGPNLVKRTSTLTKSRSLTLGSRPTSAANSDVEKPRWNPIYSFGKGVQSVVLFWRKDSFWRREPTQRQSKLEAHEISGPSDAVRRASIEEGAENGESTGGESASGSGSGSGNGGGEGAGNVDEKQDSAPHGPRLPPPAMELPVARSSSEHSRDTQTQMLAAALAAPPPAHVPDQASTQRSRPANPMHIARLLQEARNVWGSEVARERVEASKEADAGWPQEIRDALSAHKAAQQNQQPSSGGAGGGGGGGSNAAAAAGGNDGSGTATPSRVRFDQ
ncbi:unnamed protein product [Jaminaea pallidilutea]